MKNLIKNFFAFGIATTLEKLISFVLLPIYARVFLVEEFGVVDLIQTTIGVVAIFAVLQLETSLQRFYYENEGIEKKDFNFTIAIVIFGIATLLALILSIFSSTLSKLLLNKTGYELILVLAVFQIPFSSIYAILLLILRFEKNNRDFIIISITKASLFLSLILLFVLYLKLGVLGLFTSQILAIIISSVFAYLKAKKLLSFHFSIVHLKKALKYALPQFPARIGSTVIGSANKYFIAGYLSTYYLGLFSMAMRFGSIMLLFHQIFIMAWNQFIFESIKNSMHKEIFSSFFDIIVPFLFLFVAFLSLISYEIMYYLATPEYIGAYKLIGWIAFSFVLLSCKEIVDIGPKYLLKTHYLSINFLISAVFNIITLIILVPLYKLDGVIISLIFTNMLLFFLSWYNSKKIYYIPFRIKRFIVLSLPLLLVLFTMQMDFLSSFTLRMFMLLIISLIYSSFCIIAIRKYSDNKALVKI